MAVTHTLPSKGKAKGGELFKKVLRAILKRSESNFKTQAGVLGKGGEEIIIRYGNSIFVLSDKASLCAYTDKLEEYTQFYCIY